MRLSAAPVLGPALLLAAACGPGADASGGAAAAAQAAPPVRVQQGLLRGERLGGGVVAYRGVPYARPPLGDLRWRAPRPPEPWSGERPARAFAPACPQDDEAAIYYRRAARRLGRDTTSVTGVGRSSEDCLYLNLWTPARGGSEPYPVLVWVHGGAGTSGSGSEPLFRGGDLARRGAVIVTVSYRLGALGFLAHPALSAEDPGGVSGNYALHDLVRALRWIRANVSAFGGDPGRVTLAGQSAGATLVETLLVTPAARGLVQRAVSHSATWLEPRPLRDDAPGPGSASAEAAGERFVARLGVAGDADPAALRALPVDSLLAVQARAGPDLPAAPVVDGRLLPDRPGRLWAGGAFARVPLLKGSTDDEFALLMAPTPLEPAAYRAWAEDRFGARAADVLAARPPGADAEASRRQRVRVLGDEAFRAPALLLLRWTEGEIPVWLYRFAWQPDDGAVGAFHGVDLPFLFGSHAAAGWWEADPDVARLTRTVQEAWVRFASTGEPGAAALPPWPPASPDAPLAMVLDGSPRLEPLPAWAAIAGMADALQARIGPP